MISYKNTESSSKLLVLYLLLIMGLGGLLFSQQETNPSLRLLILCFSVAMPMFMAGIMFTRYQSRRFERVVLLLGMFFICIGAVESILDITQNEITERLVPEKMLQTARSMGLTALLFGFFVILYTLFQSRNNIEELAMRLEYISDHINDGFLLAKPDGAIYMANPQLFAMTGLSKEDILGRHSLELARQLNIPAFQSQSVQQASTATEYEIPWVANNDERRLWFKVSPVYDRRKRLIAILATVRDITDYHRMSDRVERYAQRMQDIVKRQGGELIRSEERFRSLLFFMNEGFLTINPQRKIGFINERMSHFLGYERTQLLAQDVFRFVHPSSRMHLLQLFVSKESSDTGENRSEINFIHRDGHLLAAQVAVSPIHESGSQGYAFSLVVSSLVEQKELQQQFEQRTSELELANQELRAFGRAKDGFLSNVSHELRTPLSTVQGYIEMFDSGSLGELNAPQQAALQVMKRNLTRLIDLITEMIEFSRMEIHGVTVTHTLFSPGRLIREAAAAIHPNTLVKNISVNVFIPEDFPCAWGDQGKLSQVLGILCSNAVKFTSHGGLIRIAAERHALHTLAISVSDTGIGIAAEHLEKIFQKFYQVDSSKTRRYEGAGIGLSIAKSIMDAHHGHIHVTSQTGQGTTFTLLFPDALFDEMDLLSMPPDDRQISLVMIDETGELDESILGLLGRLSYRTHSATNVYECIRYAEKNKVDLILLNDTRPDLAEMMNIETLRHNPATEVTPMLILTASRTIKLREASRVWDDCFMLPKPFTAVTLVAHIQHIALGKALPFHLEDMMKKELVVYERPRVMVVDEDPGMLDLMQILLHQQQYPFEGARNLHQALELAQDFPPAILFLDGDMDAEEMQRRVQFIEQSPALLQAACYTLGSPPKSADSLPFAGSLQKPPNPAELRKILIKHTHFTQT